MNRKAYLSCLGLLLLTLVFLSGCSDSHSAPPPPVETISATSGTPQTTTINTAFAAPLVARVTNGGTGVSGATVTFAAPTTGASGTFAGGVNTATTDANGMATSAVFTANGTAGGYTVTATVSGVSGSANFSLTNTAVAATNYSFYLTGMELINDGPNFYAAAGSVAIDPGGNVVAGEQDYNNAFGVTSPQPSGDTITGGTLTVDGSGQGTLTLITNNVLVGVNGTETLGVQFANADHALIVQFDGTATSSGSMDLQTLPSTLSGPFAFALSGVDPDYLPVVFGGIFSVSGTDLQNGVVDVDDAGSVATGIPFTGTISAPDAFGRGTITDTGIATVFNYYVVGPKAIRIIDVDETDSLVGSAFSQGAGAFTNASLGSSVFGVESNSFGFQYATTGMFTTVPGAGTFQGVGDVDEEGFVFSGAPMTGTYFIDPNGYGGVTITPGDLEDVSVLGVYMTDPTLNLNDPNNTTSGLGGALVADLDSFLNGTGVLTPQTDTAAGSFTDTYVLGGQDFFSLEFDSAAQGSVTGGVFAGTGLLSDPFDGFGVAPANTGVTFSGTATPDGDNPGRYTMSPFTITVGGNFVDFSVVVYQASGEQLFWMDEDDFSLSLGLFQRQGSLNGLPAARTRAAKTKRKH